MKSQKMEGSVEELGEGDTYSEGSHVGDTRLLPLKCRVRLDYASDSPRTARNDLTEEMRLPSSD